LREGHEKLRKITIKKDRKFRFETELFSRHIPQDCGSCMGKDAELLAELFHPEAR
jgi:hypothetical protein